MVLKFTMRLIIVGAVLAGLTSCTQWLFKADMADYADNRPALKLEEFFDGRSYAYGIFEDRFGNLKRQFRVQIDGRTDAGLLTLDEQFIYDDGETARRVWTIDNLGPDGSGFIRYQGRAEDIDGVATGQIAGNVLSGHMILCCLCLDSSFRLDLMILFTSLIRILPLTALLLANGV